MTRSVPHLRSSSQSRAIRPLDSAFLSAVTRLRTQLPSELVHFVLPALDNLRRSSIGWNGLSITFKDISPDIHQIAVNLKSSPKLLKDMNALLRSLKATLDCCSSVGEVDFFVLADNRGVRLFSTSSANNLHLVSGEHVRIAVQVHESWDGLLALQPKSKQWLMCLAEILQHIRDDPMTAAICQEAAFARQCSLARQLALPCSTFIDMSDCVLESNPLLWPCQRGTDVVCYRGRLMDNISDAVLLFCNFSFQSDLSPEQCQRLETWLHQEALLLRQFKHDNILLCCGVSLGSAPDEAWFAFPAPRDGDILSFLERHPQESRLKPIYAIVDALAYMHKSNPPIMHRDIQAANIFVQDDGTYALMPAKFKEQVRWEAPERMRRSSGLCEDQKAEDIFALGCAIYQIYWGLDPYPGKNANQRPRTPLPRANSSDEEKDICYLIGKCWADDPAERPDIKSVQDYLSLL